MNLTFHQKKLQFEDSENKYTGVSHYLEHFFMQIPLNVGKLNLYYTCTHRVAEIAVARLA